MRSGSEPRRYRILDVLGRGGFGTVYRAELQGTGGFVKEVALKVLNAEIEAQPQHLARLRDEARVLGLVRHRALVGVDGLVKLLDRWTVVMEFVDGVSLDDLLRAHGPFPLPIALQIVEEVASGLYAAFTSHEREGQALRLLHRDVKPSNIRLTPHGDVKLLDFGVARAEFGSREAVTSSMVFGSIRYLAPERLDLQDSHESDVFALAVTLVQLVTGALPPHATGDPAVHEETVAIACRGLGRSGAPAALVSLIQRALAWDVTVRPDARELERECRAIRTALPDRHLGDWAAETVHRFQGARVAEQGEFTGMIAVEAHTTEKHRHLAELLGSAVPTTFDDPVTIEVPKPTPTPTPVAETSAGTLHSAGNMRTAVVPPPRRIRRRTWVAVGLLMFLFGGGVVAVAALSAALGGTAVFGALVVAALSDTESACLSNVRTARQGLNGDQVKGMKRTSAFFERAQKGCRDGTLGFWSSSLLMSDVRSRAGDGTLSDADVTELDRHLTEIVSPSPVP